MAQDKKEIDVAWIPTAQAQLGTPYEARLVQSFLEHRQWMRDQKEEAIHSRALDKIEEVYQGCQKPISCGLVARPAAMHAWMFPSMKSG